MRGPVIHLSVIVPLVGVAFGIGVLSGQSEHKQTLAPHEQTNGAAPPPIEWRPPPLPKHPVKFESAEERRLRLVVLARGLEQPWSMAFLPDNLILVTERPGRVRIIRNGVLDKKPVPGIPPVSTTGAR